MSTGEFPRFLEAKALSIDGAFERFLDAEINIAKGVRSRASRSQQHIRKFLDEESERDEDFPHILRVEDNDFLGGSFGRHVKNWPSMTSTSFCPLMALTSSIPKGVKPSHTRS